MIKLSVSLTRSAILLRVFSCGWRVFILFLRKIKLRRAPDYENFEAAAKRERRVKKRAAGEGRRLDGKNSGWPQERRRSRDDGIFSRSAPPSRTQQLGGSRDFVHPLLTVLFIQQRLSSFLPLQWAICEASSPPPRCSCIPGATSITANGHSLGRPEFRGRWSTKKRSDDKNGVWGREARE